jgi:fibronectin-binding autotransporter adhesin
MLSFFIRRQRTSREHVSRQRIHRQARHRFFRPRGERLEDRRVLAVFSINDPAPIDEGDSGTSVVTFTISRSSSSGTASVQYSTSDGTATTADNDYVAIPTTTLNFANGQLSQNITVTINGDLKVELNESFAVNIFNASAGDSISPTANQGISAAANDDFDWVIDGTGVADTFNLVRSGANLVATGVPGAPITVPAVPSNGALNSITVNGLGGADTLVLDYSGGNFGGAEITYAGGNPTTGPGDSLRTLGGSFATGVSTPTSGNSGAIVYTGGTTGDSTINYTGLEPIDDLNVVANYTINATNGLNFINIVNGPIVSGTQTTQVNDGAILFERINFANKTNVTVNALDGSDQIAINNSLKGVGLASLIVNGGNGDDQFNINGPGIVSGTTYTFNGGADNDLFSVSGGLLPSAITINGNTHTGGTPSTQDRLTVNSFAANVNQTASQLQFSGGSAITFGTIEQINLNNLNTLSVSGTGAADSITLSKPSANTFRSVANSGIEVNFDKPLATVGGQFFANAADGSDTLTVDNTGRVVDLRVGYNAGTGTNDTLNVFGNPGTPVARESYNVLATQDAGRMVLDPDGNLGYLKSSTAVANGDELDISSNGLELYFTDVPATIYDVALSTSVDNATLNGDGVLLNSSASMLLADNAGTFVNTRFTKKATTTIAGFLANDTLAWNSGSLAASLTNLEFYGFLPVGLGVDDHPADPNNRDIINLTEATAAARNVTINYSDTASLIDVTGLTRPVRIGTTETVTYAGTAANNDSVTIVDKTTAVDPARVFNLTASGASYMRNGGPSGGDAGPDLNLSGLGGSSTPLTLDGANPAAIKNGDHLFYDGPFTATETATGINAGNITAAGLIGVHYQNYEQVTLAGTLTWDGGGTTNNWSEAANWNTNTIPADNAELIFPSGVPADSLSNSNDINGLDLRSITVNGNYNISGSAITLSNGLAAQFPGIPFIGLPITLVTQPQTISVTDGQLTLGAALNLNGFGLTVDSSDGELQLGSVTGSGGITKNGSGNLNLLSNSDYSGVTLINAGTISALRPNSLGATGAGNNTIVAAGATLFITGNNALNVPEAVTLNGSGVDNQGALQATSCPVAGCSMSGVITLASNSTIKASNPHPLTLNGPIGGGFDLTKIGTGTLILDGNNTYSGTTTVTAGTLLVTGLSSNSPIVVDGGRVGGNGAAGDVTLNAGVLAPGTSTGGLGTGDLHFKPGSTFEVEITSDLTGQFDQVIVSGTVTIDTTGTGVALKTLKSGTLNLQSGDVLPIINNNASDAISGTFKNLPEGTNLGSNFLGSGLTGTITYVGGTGNDVAITLSPGSLFPWHNPGILINDVSGTGTPQPDSLVVANDVLTIINYINANGSGPVPEDAIIGLPFGFLDTKADNQIVAEDALQIINYINAGRLLGGEAEAASDISSTTPHSLLAIPTPSAARPPDLLLLLATDLASQPTTRRRA